MAEKKEATDMEALRDALVENVLSMTDEEILAEAKEDNVDVDADLRRFRTLFEAGNKIAAKAKLKAAQAAVANNVFSNVTSIDPAKYAKYDAAVRAGKIGTSQLTLAARNGSELSDADRRKIIEDLIELGISPDED